MQEVIDALREISEVLKYSFEENTDTRFIKVHLPTPKDIAISGILSRLADTLESEKNDNMVYRRKQAGTHRACKGFLR